MALQGGDGPGLPAPAREHLAGAEIVLGVCGGIAAYKAVELCRRLVDAGAHVVPVLTESATRFVGPTTFSALASERARTSLFEDEDPIPHTRLGQRAQLVVVAPATARLLGELAAGIATDLLGNLLLATRAPVLLCPAMHTEMWEHPAVQENLQTLLRRGARVVPPASGRLAGGDVGAGRLADTGEILAAARAVLAGAPDGLRGGPPATRRADLAGVKVLVTAGGTREPIDPVRYLGNRSSGKQGYALAEEARDRGAEVDLVTAAALEPPPGVRIHLVETAAEMAAAVARLAPASEVVVMAAAVADFRPEAVAPAKLRKADGPPEIVLEETTDILAELGRTRRAGQVLVGFAAETGGSQAAEASAAAKLEAKRVDLVVANDVGSPGAGFAHDTNAVTILGRGGARTAVPLASKRTIAAAVLDAVVEVRARRGAGEGNDDGAGA